MSAPVWSELQVRLVDHLSGVRLSQLAAQEVVIPQMVTISNNGKE
jgi:hypothetical protein